MNTGRALATGSYRKERDWGSGEARLMLGVLESVERNGRQSQRRIALELGIALGLTNAYLRRCVRKGLLKVQQVPARRYAYYLTPKGFAEKSRLTTEYLWHSFALVRRARSEYAEIMQMARRMDFGSVVLAGVSELAEVAILCAIENEVDILAIIDANADRKQLIGRRVAESFDSMSGKFSAVIITDLQRAQETYLAAVKRYGKERVLVPSLLGVNGTTEWKTSP
jgi:DNA-binding MarR family transcriptional regulator